MSAITKTIVGLGLTERVSYTLSALPVSGYMLLPGNNTTDIWQCCKSISMQTRKPGYVLMDVEGLNDQKLLAMRDKAREYWVSGVFLRGSSIERAVRILRSDNLAIGCAVSLPEEPAARKEAMEKLAASIAAGCTSLLIEPWVQGELASQFLQDVAAIEQMPQVYYGVRPVESASRLRQLEAKGAFIPEYLKEAIKDVPERQVVQRTIEAEVKNLPKDLHVYVDGSNLSAKSIEQLMRGLSIAGKQ